MEPPEGGEMKTLFDFIMTVALLLILGFFFGVGAVLGVMAIKMIWH
jgi:hypothetical protein